MTKFFFYNYFNDIHNLKKLNLIYNFSNASYFKKKNNIIEGKVVEFKFNLNKVLKKINYLNNKENFCNKNKIRVEEIWVNNKNNQFIKCWILH